MEQTRSAMHEDEQGVVWMHTGDEGIMDKEGYLKSQSDCYKFAKASDSYSPLVSCWKN